MNMINLTNPIIAHGNSESDDNILASMSISSLIFTSFTSLLVATVAMVLIKHKRLEKEIAQQTNGIPVKNFSNVLPIIGDLNMVLDPLRYQEANHTKHGEIFATWFLNEPNVLVTGADLIDQVFYDNAKNIKLEWTKNFTDLLFGPSSILTVSGDEHKRQRRIVMNNLGVPALNRLFPGFVEIFNRIIKDWVEQTKDGSYIDIVPAVEKAVWESMSLVVFGDDLDKGTEEELRHFMGVLGLGLFAVPINLPFTTLGKAMAAKKKFREMLCNECKRREAMPDRGRGRKDFFQALINETCNDGHEEGFNIDLAMTVIYASLDTTKSTALVMIDTMIDRGVEWAKIRVDLENAFGPEGIAAPDVTYNRLERETPYMLACLKEVLRYNGVGVMSMRKVTSDIELRHNDKKYIVPAGYKICCSHYHNGTNPESKIFSYPTSFIPERFLGDDAEDKVSGFKSATSSFGGGERLCPGNPVAKLEVQIFMGLMSKYKWTRKEKVRDWNAIPFPVPTYGMYIRAEPLSQ